MKEINENKIREIKEKAKENYVPILQDDSLRLIETILEMKKPKNILEIGTAVGYSAINMCKHIQDEGHITTVELDNDTAELAKSNVLSVGLEKYITVINGDGEETMKKLVRLEEKFDVIFIDAAKGQYMKYLDLALKLTSTSSVIIADNVLFKGRVLGEYNEHKHRTAVNRLREYIKEITTNPKLESVVIDIGDGVAISVVK